MRTTPRVILILKQASSAARLHKTLAQKIVVTTALLVASINSVPILDCSGSAVDAFGSFSTHSVVWTVISTWISISFISIETIQQMSEKECVFSESDSKFSVISHDFSLISRLKKFPSVCTLHNFGLHENKFH